MRYTTFRFALDPTPAQEATLVRHAGASRFAYNECLRFVTDALAARRLDPSVKVPWSGYDLINAFNTWKKSEEAGRVFVVSGDGTVTRQVTGLAWRHTVCAQVFEEAAVDLGHALSAYSNGKQGTHSGRRVGFPGRKRKGRCRDSFRLRNKQQGETDLLRVGEGHPRSVTLPKIGMVKVHDDTRSIRRLLRRKSDDDLTARVKILFATIVRRGSRWYVALNVRAHAFHAARQHGPRPEHGAVGSLE
jgi:putative transposase